MVDIKVGRSGRKIFMFTFTVIFTKFGENLLEARLHYDII